MTEETAIRISEAIEEVTNSIDCIGVLGFIAICAAILISVLKQ